MKIKLSKRYLKDLFINLIIIIGCLFMVNFYLTKQAEIKLQEFYQKRAFIGKVTDPSIALDWQKISEDWDFRWVRLNFTYKEAVNGKEKSIPMSMSWPWVNLVLPHYEDEFLDEFLDEDKEKDYDKVYFTAYSQEEAYGPILQEALMENTELPDFERKIRRIFDSNPYFKDAEFHIESTFSTRYKPHYYMGQYSMRSGMRENLKKGYSHFGGAFPISLSEALSKGWVVIYVKTKDEDRYFQFDDNIKSIIEKGLPDGYYIIDGELYQVLNGKASR